MRYKQPLRQPVEKALGEYNTGLIRQINILERELKTLRKKLNDYIEITDTTLADHEARISTLETYH